MHLDPAMGCCSTQYLQAAAAGALAPAFQRKLHLRVLHASSSQVLHPCPPAAEEQLGSCHMLLQQQG
jgi:hypothetical protein